MKMSTEKLYYQDSFLHSFSAKVLSCEPQGKSWSVVLDRTAFYPEGGGQPADHGVLGPARVLDVHEKNDVIFHTTDRPVEIGPVSGEIDWARRFDHMQQHSGEHICSGLICARYGCDNVGFHMGSDVITIDLSVELTQEQVRELEEAANRYIWEDHPIQIAFPSPQELEVLTYRSKKALTGRVRIVSFPGADCCACCGTHVSSSGQVGLVKLLSCQKFRSGVRIELVCGKRALDHLSRVWEQNHQISNLLSAKAGETAGAVARLLEENQTLKGRLAALEDTRFAALAEQYRDAGDLLLFEEGLFPDSLRRLAAAVLETCGGRCACFSGQDGSGYRYAIGQAGGDLRELTHTLNQALSGRGGGKPNFVQGSVQAEQSAIRDFFAAL